MTDESGSERRSEFLLRGWAPQTVLQRMEQAVAVARTYPPPERPPQLALLADAVLALDSADRIIFAQRREMYPGSTWLSDEILSLSIHDAFPVDMVQPWIPVIEDATGLRTALPLWFSFYSIDYSGWIIRSGLVIPTPDAHVYLLGWHRGLRQFGPGYYEPPRHS